MNTDTLKAINTVLTFLTAAPTIPTDWQPDGLIWCGNSQLITGLQAVDLAERYQLPNIILSGGVGHATHYLLDQLSPSDRHQSEAASMAGYLKHTSNYTGTVRLEAASTNSGENAANSLIIARQLGWQRILLVQDPLLQLRTCLTFSHQAPDKQFMSCSSRLQIQSWQPLTITPTDYRWPPDYLLGLLTGEVRRLTNNRHGYGPNGQNFIDAITVPPAVLAAQQMILATTEPISR